MAALDSDRESQLDRDGIRHPYDSLYRHLASSWIRRAARIADWSWPQKEPFQLIECDGRKFFLSCRCLITILLYKVLLLGLSLTVPLACAVSGTLCCAITGIPTLSAPVTAHARGTYADDVSAIWLHSARTPDQSVLALPTSLSRVLGELVLHCRTRVRVRADKDRGSRLFPASPSVLVCVRSYVFCCCHMPRTCVRIDGPEEGVLS